MYVVVGAQVHLVRRSYIVYIRRRRAANRVVSTLMDSAEQNVKDVLSIASLSLIYTEQHMIYTARIRRYSCESNCKKKKDAGRKKKKTLHTSDCDLEKPRH